MLGYLFLIFRNNWLLKNDIDKCGFTEARHPNFMFRMLARKDVLRWYINYYCVRTQTDRKGLITSACFRSTKNKGSANIYKCHGCPFLVHRNIETFPQRVHLWILNIKHSLHYSVYASVSQNSRHLQWLPCSGSRIVGKVVVTVHWFPSCRTEIQANFPVFQKKHNFVKSISSWIFEVRKIYLDTSARRDMPISGVY